MICQWASCQIHKIAGAHAPGMPGTFSPPLHVSDPDMHHGTCVTHVPWCMPDALKSAVGENVPGIPGACATRNFTYLVRGPWNAAQFTVQCRKYIQVEITMGKHCTPFTEIVRKHTIMFDFVITINNDGLSIMKTPTLEMTPQIKRKKPEV